MTNKLPSGLEKKFNLDKRRILRSIHIGHHQFQGGKNGVYEKYPLKATLTKKMMEDDAGNYSMQSYIHSKSKTEFNQKLMQVCNIQIELGGKEVIEIEIIDASNGENQGLSRVSVKLGQESEFFIISPYDKEVFKSGILTDHILDIISQIWKHPSVEETHASVKQELVTFWKMDPNSTYIQLEVARVMKNILPPYNG